MSTQSMKWFFGFLVGMLILVTIVFALLSGGGGSKSSTTTSSKPLSSYASTSAVTSLLIEGPINANSLHRQIRISVDNDNVTMDVINGYQGKVVSSNKFANNINSYSAFLSALARAGFGTGFTDPVNGDGASVCPTAQRYRIQMVENGKPLAAYWAGSCGSNRKTYPGSLNLTISLFQAQVPNYSSLTQNVDTY